MKVKAKMNNFFWGSTHTYADPCLVMAVSSPRHTLFIPFATLIDVGNQLYMGSCDDATAFPVILVCEREIQDGLTTLLGDFVNPLKRL